MNTALEERVQTFITCAMDCKSFYVGPLPLVGNEIAWENASKFPAAFAAVGDIALRTNVENIIVDLFGMDFEHRELLLAVLTSPTTVARLLLSEGSYEDMTPCPFIGMRKPEEVGESFRMYLATYLISLFTDFLALECP
ncbi:hypothetical protein C8F04DRAFT_1262285 [Mycena alexandri]|uniref:Uncharacterized protein n=1 Tax=Mycena alexandri TaxID=1745969 RepID=A0AAD6SQG2_9AGAR|nr:hypothetical protein C8F04DRAFT_1262285 [Mycena alexandri]